MLRPHRHNEGCGKPFPAQGRGAAPALLAHDPLSCSEEPEAGILAAELAELLAVGGHLVEVDDRLVVLAAVIAAQPHQQVADISLPLFTNSSHLMVETSIF